MAKAPSTSDAEFIATFEKYGAIETARILGLTERAIYWRRKALEERGSGPIVTPNKSHSSRRSSGYIKRLNIDIPNGIVMIGSDAHYWPGEPSCAHRGFLFLVKRLKPKAVILNGDVFDGASTGRHGRIGWAQTPTTSEELEAVDIRTEEIRKAAGNAGLYWTLGNHDIRFETYFSNHASAVEAVKGTRLSDHFPHWKMCWSIWINNDAVVKHRWNGGIHATHNNTLKSGKSIFTGHLHSAKVTPYTDYNGDRYGGDSGTLAEIDGEHTDYDEDNPKNHRSGGLIVTFVNGKLLYPELFLVVDPHHIQFRGEIFKV